jgi:hypothetical protein
MPSRNCFSAGCSFAGALLLTFVLCPPTRAGSYWVCPNGCCASNGRVSPAAVYGYFPRTWHPWPGAMDVAPASRDPSVPAGGGLEPLHMPKPISAAPAAAPKATPAATSSWLPASRPAANPYVAVAR